MRWSAKGNSILRSKQPASLQWHKWHFWATIIASLLLLLLLLRFNRSRLPPDGNGFLNNLVYVNRPDIVSRLGCPDAADQVRLADSLAMRLHVCCSQPCTCEQLAVHLGKSCGFTGTVGRSVHLFVPFRIIWACLGS